jgi:hypothetical protein
MRAPSPDSLQSSRGDSDPALLLTKQPCRLLHFGSTFSASPRLDPSWKLTKVPRRPRAWRRRSILSTRRESNPRLQLGRLGPRPLGHWCTPRSAHRESNPVPLAGGQTCSHEHLGRAMRKRQGSNLRGALATSLRLAPGHHYRSVTLPSEERGGIEPLALVTTTPVFGTGYRPFSGSLPICGASGLCPRHLRTASAAFS